MEASKKFKLKKQIRTYLTIAWSLVGFFILYVLTIVLSNVVFGEPLGVILANAFHTTTQNPTFLIIMIVVLVTPLFAGMMFTMLSQASRQELYSYRNSIHLYRTRKFAMEILTFVQEGNIEAAVNVYKKFDLGYDRKLDDYIYGILLGCSKYSGNEKYVKVFNDAIMKIKEKYNPDKVIL